MMDDYPLLQCEAARVLKDIAAENAKMVIDCGAVPVLVKLLESSNLEACEQAAGALGNIAGDSPRCRDIVLDCGALTPLLTLLKVRNEISLLRVGTWALSNFLDGEPEAPLEQLESAVPILASLILTDDEAFLKEASWALFYLSRCGSGLKLATIETDIFYKLGKLLRNAPQSVLFPAIQATTSIMIGTDMLDERPLVLQGSLTTALRKKVSPCVLKVAENLYWMLHDRAGDIVCSRQGRGKEGGMVITYNL